MSLQLAVLAAARTSLQAAVPSMAMEAIQVTTKSGEGVAMKVERQAADYEFGDDEAELNALLTFTLASGSLAKFEAAQDALFAKWEKFQGSLTHHQESYRVRECHLASESKDGGDAAGQLYVGTQTYAIVYEPGG